MARNASPPAPPETFDYEEYQHHLDLVRTYGPTMLFMDRVIRKVSAPFKDLDVLDLGCGVGHLSLLMERHNRVVSYDPAFEGVKTTRARRRTRGGYVVGGGEHLPFHDGSFDVILLIDVLEHIADDAGVAREATRVLRPGGRVLCMVPENQALYSRADEANGHLRRYARDELVRLFPSCDPETLFDFGFPFMRMYLGVLGSVHDTVVPQQAPTGFKRAAIRAVSVTLAALFSLDLLFAGWFRGVEIVAVFRKPGT